MGVYTVKIETGNSEMDSPVEVAGALRALAARLDGWPYGWPSQAASDEAVLDVNGNRVGTATFRASNEEWRRAGRK